MDEGVKLSHFAVAVLSDGTKTLEELLAPYQENNMGNVPKEYLEFVITEDEYREDYKTKSETFFYVAEENRMFARYDNFFKKPDAYPYGFCSSNYEVPDGLPKVEIPMHILFSDFDDYMSTWVGEERDPETGLYGYWENPNAKWDWWEVGGRWENWAVETIGGTSLRVGDIAFDPERERRKAEEWWDSKPDSLYFSLAVRDRSKEEYLESQSHLSFRACITPDGTWHEVGEMYQFGMSSESGDEMQDWDLAFAERFLSNPDLMLTVVDCHI